MKLWLTDQCLIPQTAIQLTHVLIYSEITDAGLGVIKTAIKIHSHIAVYCMSLCTEAVDL